MLIVDRRKPKDVFSIRRVSFEKTINQVYEERRDKWSCEVAGRVAFAIDLQEEETLYHQKCSINFRIGRNISNNDMTPMKI